MRPVDYARMAAQAYILPPSLGDPNSASRAVVFPSGVVGFPGTDNVACWLADLDVATVDVMGLGRLHAGFWNAAQSLLEGIFGLNDIQVLVGHSEGAALALLIGAQLCMIGQPPEAIYAFEPPRVTTDGTLRDLFADSKVSLYLTQKGNDVVPMVPRLTEDWQHPSPLVPIGKALLPFPNVEDHKIEGVIAALE